jgi:hypothetical protein
MATVDIALAAAQSVGRSGGTMPVIDAIPIDTDLISSSGSSVQSDFAVPAGAAGLFWVITVTGGNVRVKFNDNPTAVAAEDGGWLVLNGQTREFGAVAGHKAAVITAEV